MYADHQLLPISALQHLLFCPRQCALIHLEGLWAENRLTVEGSLLHKKAHDPRKGASRPGVRIARGLHLASYRLGLFGIADIVEFPTRDPPTPVEYKRGRPKAHDADKIQLCAQALCLEEMLTGEGSTGHCCHIPVGAIFYGQTRRRLEVPLDAALRQRTEAAARQLHAMIDARHTPPAKREPKCDHCSLLHLCLPDAISRRTSAGGYLRRSVSQCLAVSGSSSAS